jgi:hypothetical protein
MVAINAVHTMFNHIGITVAASQVIIDEQGMDTLLWMRSSCLRTMRLRTSSARIFANPEVQSRDFTLAMPRLTTLEPCWSTYKLKTASSSWHFTSVTRNKPAEWLMLPTLLSKRFTHCSNSETLSQPAKPLMTPKLSMQRTRQRQWKTSIVFAFLPWRS